MGKYMVVYTGGGGMGASPEEQQRIMGEWGVWYEKLGSSIVDGGSPFGDAKHMSGSGVADGPLGDNPLTGYTVITADSLDAAAAACGDHPHIGHGGQVQVYTCIDMSPPE